jgi:hypothetical protein
VKLDSISLIGELPPFEILTINSKIYYLSILTVFKFISEARSLGFEHLERRVSRLLSDWFCLLFDELHFQELSSALPRLHYLRISPFRARVHKFVMSHRFWGLNCSPSAILTVIIIQFIFILNLKSSLLRFKVNFDIFNLQVTVRNHVWLKQ